LLQKKFLIEALELFLHPFDLPPRCGTLLLIEFHRLGASQSPMSALQNRRRHLQIADHFGRRFSWRGLLPLRFEEQRGIIENALTDRGRSSPPCGIELPRRARIAVVLGEDLCHALAVLQTLPRRRRQKLHRHLRTDLTRAHLLLNRFR